jgi:pimeloyl-ACP methyl ester carboxylesterase
MVALGLSERYDSLSSAASVTCPTLVVHGGQDSIIPVDQGQSLAEAIVGSRWLVVEGASHNDLLGFEAVWRQVNEFLAPLGSLGRL